MDTLNKTLINLLTKGTIVLHYKNEGGDKLNEILKESFGATEKQTEEGYYYRDVRNLAGYRLALPTRTLPFDSYGMIFDKAGIIGLPDFYEYTSPAKEIMKAQEARKKADEYNFNEEDFKIAISYITAAVKAGFYNATIPFEIVTTAIESKLKSWGYELRVNDNRDMIVHW
jgi:hypothetical protein